MLFSRFFVSLEQNFNQNIFGDKSVILDCMKICDLPTIKPSPIQGLVAHGALLNIILKLWKLFLNCSGVLLFFLKIEGIAPSLIRSLLIKRDSQGYLQALLTSSIWILNSTCGNIIRTENFEIHTQFLFWDSGVLVPLKGSDYLFLKTRNWKTSRFSYSPPFYL